MGELDDLDATGRAVQNQLWEAREEHDRPPPPGAAFAPDFFALVRRFCFGSVWARPVLSIRDRSLVTVAVLAATRCNDELAAHLRGARNLGIGEEELAEVLMHVAMYAGIPAGAAAVRTAEAVFGRQPNQ